VLLKTLGKFENSLHRFWNPRHSGLQPTDKVDRSILVFAFLEAKD
jgi:hypothetical protein